jgi:uroporphyrinogen-III decarboxylase
MKETMTPRERWLAAIDLKPVDRLPFWPKLGPSYAAAQAAPFNGMDLDAIHDWIGSDRQTGIRHCGREVRERTSVETTQTDTTRETVFRATQGELKLVEHFDVPSQSWHPVEFPVKTLDDIRLITEVFADASFVLDKDALARAQQQVAEIGQEAVTAINIGESPLMYWVEWLAGVENAHTLLMDHAEAVEDLFGAIHGGLIQKARILCEHSPADLLYMVENTSTTLISPAQFHKYCVPHLGEYARIAQAAGRNPALHMCGHLKALLPDLAKIGARVFEAFTSPTLGNTTLLDGRTACPDVCLIGGTNATLWTRPADEIIAQIKEYLDALPHHRGIIVTSAGVMPPLCPPETIKQVCDWVKTCPAKNESPKIRPISDITQHCTD